MGWSVSVTEVCLPMASCSDCDAGWQGPVRDNEAEAERDRQEHYDWHVDRWRLQNEAWERGEGQLADDVLPCPVPAARPARVEALVTLLAAAAASLVAEGWTEEVAPPVALIAERILQTGRVQVFG